MMVWKPLPICLDYEVSSRVQQILAPLIMDMERESMQREEKKAKEDPLANKMSRVFPAKQMGYRFWATKDGRGSTVRFCYSSHRNVAGFFLGWRETWYKGGKVKRDKWISRRKRRRCSEVMKARFDRHVERTKSGQTAAGEIVA